MKTITQEELNNKIQLHKKWLEGNPEGKKMKLNYYDLRCLDLSNSSLIDADLSVSNLSKCNLSNCNLRYVNLSNANLGNVDLSNSILNNCNLSDAYLYQANTQNVSGKTIYSIDNIGTFKGKVTYLPEYDRVFAGCWGGSLEEFLEKGLEMNKEDEKEKRNIINAYQFFYGTTID